MILDYEINFINMISLISNGSKVMLAKQGDSVKFQPGMIINNDKRDLAFDCGESRAISYYVEYICLLGLFGKTDLDITMTGITNDNIDMSIDSLAQTIPKIVEQFNLSPKQVTIKVLRRGFRPNGQGAIQVHVTKINWLDNCIWMNEGLVKRIRGTCYASKASVNIIGRIIASTREVLNDYIPDVWIYSEYSKGAKGSVDPGYGITLVGETNTGCSIVADNCFSQFQTESGNNPEEIGRKAALQLVDEIFNSGVVDTSAQPFLLMMMALSGGKPSVAKLGRVSAFS